MVSFRQANINKAKLKYFEIPRFEKLTYLINGVRENELITISARVGCGKTTLALNLFTELAKKNKCWYISYEMNNKELIDKIYKFCKKPTQDNMWFDDSCNVFDTDYIKKTIKKYGFKFIFIDYLQLMGGNIKKNTRALKEICRDCNVVIFMLAQLNRKAENVEPQLSMLKDSGTIEQDSDGVWFIKEHSIKVAKNRKSDVGEIPVVFDKENSYFYESNEYFDKRQELIDKFNEMCCSYLDDKLENEVSSLYWYTRIDSFLEQKVLPFDKELYKGLNKVFIKVIDDKTDSIDDDTYNGIWVENINLL